MDKLRYFQIKKVGTPTNISNLNWNLQIWNLTTLWVDVEFDASNYNVKWHVRFNISLKKNKSFFLLLGGAMWIW